MPVPLEMSKVVPPPGGGGVPFVPLCQKCLSNFDKLCPNFPQVFRTSVFFNTLEALMYYRDVRYHLQKKLHENMEPMQMSIGSDKHYS